MGPKVKATLWIAFLTLSMALVITFLATVIHPGILVIVGPVGFLLSIFMVLSEIEKMIAASDVISSS